MNYPLTPIELGTNILIVLDDYPACLDMLATVVSQLPDMPKRSITLLHCCSMFHYDLEEDLAAVEREFQLEQHYLYQVNDILHSVGVPANHLTTATAMGEDSIIPAILAELKRKAYTGLVVRSRIARHLRRRGILKEDGHMSNIVVWVVPTDIVTLAPAF